MLHPDVPIEYNVVEDVRLIETNSETSPTTITRQ